MERSGEGLTKTYNRFYDRYENDPDIARLRQLHGEMDRAVLGEYGWDDIAVRCEFLSDFEAAEEPTSKRFWRYCWPDEIRDEVLGRLIELNSERAREELQREEASTAEPGPRAQTPPTTIPGNETSSHNSLASPPLFDGDGQ